MKLNTAGYFPAFSQKTFLPEFAAIRIHVWKMFRHRKFFTRSVFCPLGMINGILCGQRGRILWTATFWGRILEGYGEWGLVREDPNGSPFYLLKFNALCRMNNFKFNLVQERLIKFQHILKSFNNCNKLISISCNFENSEFCSLTSSFFDSLNFHLEFQFRDRPLGDKWRGHMPSFLHIHILLLLLFFFLLLLFLGV